MKDSRHRAGGGMGECLPTCSVCHLPRALDEPHTCTLWYKPPDLSPCLSQQVRPLVHTARPQVPGWRQGTPWALIPERALVGHHVTGGASRQPLHHCGHSSLPHRPHLPSRFVQLTATGQRVSHLGLVGPLPPLAPRTRTFPGSRARQQQCSLPV